jgi:phosphoenolpyruvate carboxykinase (GTP)
MSGKNEALFKSKMDSASLAKLTGLENDKLYDFLADAIALCEPAKVAVFDDSPADHDAIRQLAKDNREEASLVMDGHTIHFDSCNDLARDPGSTKYLLPPGMTLGKGLLAMGREEGLKEIRSYLAGCMKGRTMIVCFFCLGPTGSVFAIPCTQITDSGYVAHSETLLYRGGYEQFRKIGNSGEFFRFLHSAGRLGPDLTSIDTDKRRIYIDIAQDMVLSVNTQYAGNTVGLKKLALRLAIRKADRDGWLAEHMFTLGVNGPGGRKTYFCGAFPSACGKTSTAMLPGESIVGDDLAYFRVIDGKFRAANVEKGIFGIIQDVNPKNDPVIYKVLTTPGEVVFSNVLVKDGKPHWLGMGCELPAEGVNASGRWTKGKKDAAGREIPASDGNARYTISLHRLANVDAALNDPAGVVVGGIIYGGRDSDTWAPVQQSFSWRHGIVTMGASLESETTAATIGQQGVRKFNLMSNMDFVAIPLGKYIQNNLDFAAGLPKAPPIFGVNYFLRGADGNYLNGMLDKAVWVKWAELRVHGQVEAIKGPTGFLPKYADLKKLFGQVLGKDYTQAQYDEQFKIRVKENLAKLDRITKVYQDIADAPKAIFEELSTQRDRLLALQKAKGDYVLPEQL